MADGLQALADAETYLSNFLEHFGPPREAELFKITEAAQDHYDSTGSWEFMGADPQCVEDLLVRHAK